MGVSILLIMLYHSFLGLTSNAFYKLTGFGEIGVELFMLISGIGIWFSLDKDIRTGPFYHRRFKRIIPSYLMVAGVFFLWQDIIKEFKPLDFLSNLFRIPYFTEGNRWFWFIVLIVVCYLLAPLLYRWIKAGRFRHWHVLLLLALAAAMCLLFPGRSMSSLRLLLFRIPSFALGMMAGRRIKEDPVCETGKLNIAIAVIALCLLPFGPFVPYKPELRFTVFFFAAPAVLWLFAVMFEAASKRAAALNAAFIFLGGITLECYLLHEAFILRYTKGFVDTPLLWMLVSIAVTIPVAWLVHRISKWIADKI